MYLDLDFTGSSLLTLLGLHVGFETHDTTSPDTTSLLVLVSKVDLDGRDESSKLLLVFRLDINKGKSSGSLLVDKCSQTGLGLDNAVRDTHLAAEGWEPDNEFNGVDIVGNDNEGGLLGFNEGSDVVDTVLDDNGLLALVDLVTGSSGLSGSSKTGLLLNLGLGAVLVEELEELGSSVLVKSLVELVDSGRDLETLGQDGLLALETDVLGPLDVTGEVAGRLDVLTDSKVASVLLNEGVLGLGGDLGLDGVGSGSNFL